MPETERAPRTARRARRPAASTRPAGDSPRKPPGRRLVVIGASAGGIEALSIVLAGLHPGFPAPIVIAQHLDPRRPSHLAEILGRHAKLVVRLVDDHAPLEDGVVFVVPSNRNVEITDDQVRLRPRRGTEPTASVDRLLTTAAIAFKERLVAVILTGSGSDGSAGALAVKAAGGIVVIENPTTAAFPSMPQSLPSAIVDAVSDLDGMAQLLNGLVTTIDTTLTIDGTAVKEFLDDIRTRSGVDFGRYKRPTILRRLQTRMSATGQRTLTDYARLVRADQMEYERLVSSLLIKVTEFFRDPRLWRHLADHLLPELVDDARTNKRELRVWSAGCATGEEAYSLAILAAEALGEDANSGGLKIFATDLDPAAIAFARRGTYPATALKDVPAALRERYFRPSAAGFEIVKRLRDVIVFGEHDLGARAPFPRMDLILCRNVLIYFTPAMQRTALETFAFSLRPGGLLVLGSSETNAAHSTPFIEANGPLRVYRRGPNPEQILQHAGSRDRTASRVGRRTDLDRAIAATRRDVGRRPESADAVAKILLELSAGIVVVDRHYDIERINGAARRLLGIHGTAFEQDFIHLAEALPSNLLREAVDAALAGRASSSVYVADAVVGGSDGARKLRVSIAPHRPASTSIEGAVIELVDVTEGERERPARARAEKQRERLLRANDELARAVADLRTANEVMLFSSEDAQSARAEAETLNEELQATNEELETLNEELQASVEELTTANEDLRVRTAELAEEHKQSAQERSRLESILSSQADAVLAVDSKGRTVLTNQAYERMFGSTGASFEPHDAAGLPLPPGAWPQRRAAAGERFSMDFTLTGADGNRRWFEAVAEPLTAEDRSWGGVVSIRDVTERTVRALLEQVLAAASHELRTPVAALYGYIQLVERQLARGDAERAARYATSAATQASRLGDLVEQLFEVSRIRSGQLELEGTEEDLPDVVARAVDVARGLAGAAPIVVVGPRTPPRLTIDSGRIEQLILILLANAIEHAPESERIEVSIRRAGGWVRVAVRDSGPGIAANDLASLFTPFVRLGAAGRPASAGLGLGLYIAQQIAIAHHGEILVESKVGLGSTFTLRLPTGPAQIAPLPSRRSARP
jgi:two-component system CheB/CheR fusion protein